VATLGTSQSPKAGTNLQLRYLQLSRLQWAYVILNDLKGMTLDGMDGWTDGWLDGWMVGWLAFECSTELEGNYFWRFWPLNPWLTEFLTRCLCQASSRPTTPRQGHGLSDFFSFYPLMEGI